jgi:hypothetical protein
MFKLAFKAAAHHAQIIHSDGKLLNFTVQHHNRRLSFPRLKVHG